MLLNGNNPDMVQLGIFKTRLPCKNSVCTGKYEIDFCRTLSTNIWNTYSRKMADLGHGARAWWGFRFSHLFSALWEPWASAGAQLEQLIIRRTSVSTSNKEHLPQFRKIFIKCCFPLECFKSVLLGGGTLPTLSGVQVFNSEKLGCMWSKTCYFRA